MYKVVIAEDESIIRCGLAGLLDWAAFDCEIVFLAEDGMQALKYMEENPVDILITDIKMPHMGGLDLIENAKSISSDMITLIISGYSDFEYAKTAIHYGVSGYLMKPVEEEQLRDALNKAVSALKLRTQQAVVQQDMLQIKEKNRRLRREKILNTLLFANGQPPSIPEELGITPELYYCVFLFELMSDMIVSARNVWEMIGKEYKNVALIDMQHNLITAVVFGESPDYVSESVKDFQYYLLENIGKKHAMNEGAGDIRQGFDGLRSSLKRAVVNFNLGQASTRLNHIAGQTGEIDVREKCNKILSYILQKKDGLPEYLDLIEEDLLMTGTQCIKNADVLLSGVYAQSIAALLSRRTNVSAETLLGLHKTYDRATRSVELRKKIQLLQELLCDVSELMVMEPDSKGKWGREINQAIAYIEKNYYKGSMDVGEIAEHVGMNPRYFSMVFKDKVGKSVMKYLIDYRVKIAKQLLLDKDLKAYQVAEMVGYDNYPYFSTMFQKVTGENPTAYLERVSNFVRDSEMPSDMEKDA